MPPARTHAVALTGAEGHCVEIHADTGRGPAGLLLSGLPEVALRETRDRIRAAVINSGEAWPQASITVQLSPAALPKRGSSFDLAIAVAILAAAGTVPVAVPGGAVFLSELGLDGQLRPIRGILPAATTAAAAGFGAVIVAAGNAAEAALVPGIAVISAPSLAAVLAWLRGSPGPDADAAQVYDRAAAGGPAAGGQAAGPRPAPDLADMAGRPVARHVAEVCAAGGHHLLVLGPPGAGKVMLAERIPAIMPPLDEAEALEVTALHSLAGVLPPGSPLVSDPPLISPHHTASLPAIIGGGNPPRPGAASLAHRGVLFLDQAPQFARDVLDALRQPLESGQVTLARGNGITRFPAAFTLVLAASPCPCATAAAPGAACGCSPAARRRYRARLDGPLRDRADLKIELQLRPRATLLLSDPGATEPGPVAAARVAAARHRAVARLAGTGWRLNAEVPGSELRLRFLPAAGAMAPLEHAIELGVISQRALARVLGVAWTLADLAGKPRPEDQETFAALGLYLGRPA